MSSSTNGEPAVARILVVEDSPEFQVLIAAALRDSRFDLALASNGTEARVQLEAAAPDLAILDWELPDADGSELCAAIRATTDASVLMLTGRDSEEDILAGFASGADDYVTKPFSPRQLMARVDAILSRRRPVPVAMAGAATCLHVEEEARRVIVDGDEVELTRIEFDLLATLTSRPSMVFSRDVLLETVWGADSFGDTHVVDVHVANLRKKIDRGDHRHITTVRGVGYRLAALEVARAGR